MEDAQSATGFGSQLGDVERETGLRVLKVRKINPRD